MNKTLKTSILFTIGSKALHLLPICLIALMPMLSSCSDDDDDPTVKPAATGTMQDKDGNTYNWVRIGNLDWMAENMKGGTPFWELTTRTMWGSQYAIGWSFIDEVHQWYNDFGNFYSYEQAIENCPDGWRLPTDDDWKNLERNLGMKNVDNLGWRSGAGLLLVQSAEQGTGLGMKFGGEMCKWGYGSPTDNTAKPYRQYAEGMYWTSTIDTTYDDECAFFRKIMPRKNAVERNSCTTFARYMSVRYVRDAQ